MSETLIRATLRDLVFYTQHEECHTGADMRRIAAALAEEMRIIARGELHMLEMQRDDHEMAAGACLKDNERLTGENERLREILALWVDWHDIYGGHGAPDAERDAMEVYVLTRNILEGKKADDA